MHKDGKLGTWCSQCELMLHRLCMSPLAANACCNIRLGDVAFLDAIKDTRCQLQGAQSHLGQMGLPCRP
jgi:hypothetical protein